MDSELKRALREVCEERVDDINVIKAGEGEYYFYHWPDPESIDSWKIRILFTHEGSVRIGYKLPSKTSDDPYHPITEKLESYYQMLPTYEDAEPVEKACMIVNRLSQFAEYADHQFNTEKIGEFDSEHARAIQAILDAIAPYACFGKAQDEFIDSDTNHTLQLGGKRPKSQPLKPSQAYLIKLLEKKHWVEIKEGPGKYQSYHVNPNAVERAEVLYDAIVRHYKSEIPEIEEIMTTALAEDQTD